MKRTPPERRRLSPRLFAFAAALALAVALLSSGPTARAQAVPDCGGVSVVAERDGAVVFRLPDQAGQTFTVLPDDELLVRAENVPSSGRVEVTLTMPFGLRVAESHDWSGLTPGESYELVVRAEEFTQYVRGAYNAKIRLSGEQGLLCEVPVTVSLAGFEGIVPRATAGAAAATGAAATAATVWSASGTGLKLRLRLAVRRRRRRGWRRWIPIPAWRRTLFSTAMGLLTGLVATVALQQAGMATLTTGSVISGAALGGGASFGVGMVWGSVLSSFRKPEDGEEEETPPAPPAAPAAPGGPSAPPPARS